MDILALYFRLSLEDLDKQHHLIDESQGISNQRKLVLDFVARHPELSRMKVVEYFDDGFTGTNFDRPQFTAMIDAAKRGEVKCIVVKDLSRFGRNYLEVGDYLEHIFPFLGVRFIAVNDNFDSNDYMGKTGGMDVAFRNFIYDSYSKDLSVKVRSAMRTRMEKGRFVNHVPYGYQKSPENKHRMVPDPETAPIVREIFLMAIGGISTSEIAKELNSRGVPTPLEYKGHKIKPACENRELMWSHTKILNILHNLKYTGAMTNHTRENRHMRDKNQRRVPQEEWIITEDAHEAIVSREEFKAADRALRKIRYKPHEHHDVSDRVFYCGHCGRKLRKTFGSDTYFSCDTPVYQVDAACAGIRWSRADLEKVLLPIYQAQLELLGQTVREMGRDSIAVTAVDFTHVMARIEASIAACDTEKITLYERYREGQLSRDAFIQRKADLDAKKARLQEEHLQTEDQFQRQKEERAQAESDFQKAQRYLSGLDAAPEQLKREMYGAIERVELFDNKHISVQWKFEDLFTRGSEAEQRAG